jgi:CO/xanthine dehydrogenase FAD-binding subunit
MFSRPFRYERAERLAEASDLLRRYGEDAKVIAGGQSLMPLINIGLAAPHVVIDISRADRDGRPRAIASDNGHLTIGALVTHARLAADEMAAQMQPLLGAAAVRIGNSRVRNRGTLGGSLAHSDPAAELPLAMVALGAEYEVSNGEGARHIRAEDFHLGFLTTPLEADELIISARVPSLGPGWGWAFQEFSRRDGDFALAAAAALVRSSGGAIVESRVAVGGVSDRPVRLADIEIALSGATTEEAADRVGAIRGIGPVSDTGASAAYRVHLAEVLVRRAVTEGCQRSEAAHV